MRSGFFNSNITGYDEEGNPIYDRAEEASFFAQYFANFIGNGVYPNPSNGMQIVANSDMKVTVSEGYCFINGYFGMSENDELTLEPADEALTRIDRIVARLNIQDRTITPAIKKGTPASMPVAPSVERNSNIYEIALADITIPKNLNIITQANITDVRLNKEVCGIVTGIIEQVDTSTLFEQYSTWFNEMKNEAESNYSDWFNGFTEPSEEEFTNWFNNIKDQLSEDAAGNLQLQIDKLQDNIENTLKISSTEPNSKSDVWIQHSKNIFNKNSLFAGYRLSSDGNLFADTAYSTTTYIPVRSNSNYVTNWTLETRECICYYDANYSFISRNETNNKFTTPSNCKYIRASRLTTNVNITQIETGQASTSYQEYVDNDFLVNENGVYSSINQENNVIWEGEAYTSGTRINLSTALKKFKMYVMEFAGLSSTYYVYFTFVYDKNYIQYSYSDGTDKFRYRFDILENGKTLNINQDSINNNTNTKLVKIFEIN